MDGIQNLFENENIHFCEPIGYVTMQSLIKFAKIIITDSGGLQKEAFYHRVPCVTIRSETEWPETIELGWNRLADPCDINFPDLIENLQKPTKTPDINPYGSGQTTEKILNLLECYK